MYKRCSWTFLDFLNYNAIHYPDNIALHDEENSFTWKEVKKIVETTVNLFSKKYGIKHESFVFYVCENTIEDILILYSLLILGSRVVISREVRDDLINDERFEFLISNCEIQLLHSGKKDIIDRKLWNIKNYFALDVENCQLAETIENFIMLYTSGTEGKEKCVLLSQYSFINNAINMAELMKLKTTDKTCLVNPLYHCFGLAVLFSSLVKGAAIYVPKSIKYNYLLQKIFIYNVTILSAVPTFFLGMKEATLFSENHVASIRAGIIAGGKYSEEQFLDISRKFDMLLLPTYGMTETCAAVTFCNINDSNEKRAHNVGKFIDGVLGCIKNDQDEILPPYIQGEVCVKGYNLMKGYYCDSIFNSHFTDADGWYHTGDIGYLDEEGYLYITERIKNIIIRGGENISPQKIAREILKYESVYECVVVGIDDSYYGEVPCALINIKEEKFDKEKFELHLKNVLKKEEIPKKIMILEEIPKNQNGKYDIEKIKQLFI